MGRSRTTTISFCQRTGSPHRWFLNALADDVTTFAINGNRVARVPNYDGRFPNVDSLAEDLCSVFSVPIDARLLAGLLQVAAEFADSETSRVLLHFSGKGKPLLVTCQNDEGQRFQGVVMPLS
jgi:hypothetical protein